MKKVLIALMLLVIVLISAYSCAPTISQQEYDMVNDELTAARSQLNSLQGRLVDAEKLQAQSTAQNEELSKQNDVLTNELKSVKTTNDELSNQYDALVDKLGASQTKYDELIKQNDAAVSELEALQVKYAELNSKYQELAKQPGPITEKDLEIVIFSLINLERIDNGLKELSWGDNIYSDARNNSLSMATNQRFEYPVQGSHKEVWRAAGYTDTETTAEAILTIWKNTEYYKEKFLNRLLDYGVIGVYKSGEIYNITYIADSFR